ncbi:cell wall anchor protein [Micromonospora sp. NPDC049081]|uniref:RCC1 domain-containing protein n=1 Tax=Micromonospora sp. NPDC049081 TaxID=3155150 RepID=UPI0033E7FB97
MGKFCLPEDMSAVMIGGARRAAVTSVLVVLTLVAVVGDASVSGANGKPAGLTAASAVAQRLVARQAPAELGAVTAIAAGYGHSLALRSDGTVLAWGRNSEGQLGDGTVDPSLTPVRVCAVGQVAPCTRFLTGVIAIAAGFVHSVALLRDRTLVAWGQNVTGQLGDGTFTDRSVPVRVCAVGEVAPCSQFLSGVRAIASGDSDHNLALLVDGAVVAWGFNAFGQLGDGGYAGSPVPVRVCAVGESAPCGRFLSGARSIAVGEGHSLAVVGTGYAVAWGFNGAGEVGDGTSDNFRPIPVRVCAVGETAPCDRFLNGVSALAAGAFHSMALLGSGSVVSWGYNVEGQIGDGTRDNHRVCAEGQVAPCDRFLYGVRHIAANGFHSLAQLSSGGVLAWGYNGYGQLGDGTRVNRLTPVRVCAVGEVAPCGRFLYLIRAIAAGIDHNLALQPNYTVVAWGLNNHGQLGDGTTSDRSVPVQVLAPQGPAKSSGDAG